MIDWDAAVVGPSMAVFGEPVQYRQAGGAAFTVQGVFDNNNRSVNDLTGDPVQVSAPTPVLGVRAKDFSVPPAQDDVVTVPSVGLTYRVREANEDSHGWVLLKLNRITP